MERTDKKLVLRPWARWTKMGRQYITTHIDDPLLPIEDIRDAVRDIEEGRFIPDREDDELTRALKIKNTQDEHEARQAPSVGNLHSLRKARNILIKAIRGGRKGRQLRKRQLRERKWRMRLRKRLP